MKLIKINIVIYYKSIKKLYFKYFYFLLKFTKIIFLRNFLKTFFIQIYYVFHYYIYL